MYASLFKFTTLRVFQKPGSGGLDPNPWYIYECIPFLKDVPGYDDFSDDKQNTILVNQLKTYWLIH
jgi:hypothetical protein